MSDLSELIKINRNIEKQNEEIIRLLKKIAGEKEEPKDPFALDKEMSRMFVSKMVEDLAERASLMRRANPLSRPLQAFHWTSSMMSVRSYSLRAMTYSN